MKKLVLGLIIILILLMNIPYLYASSNIPEKYEQIHRGIEEDVRKYHIPSLAVAVVNKDEVLFEGLYGQVESVHEPFIIGSISKSFTALAILQLAEQNKLDLNDSIEKYPSLSK